ncbi:polygalacturonase [Flavobacterium sp. 270]|uniref:glycoside hydrolase family 28 protein n=1 Tax=Flavobacterium sp. 270 TaxID=2512114 RepID=UPI0010649E29|nr:glycosyl hydrolase family 28 protein [Flavobacterium sp. 270]TDW48152.1 polygalacturonase [Flavobacterium sp. 270]
MKNYLILFFSLIALHCTAKNINIVEYGAIADGKTLNTKIVQKAIDDCSASGGGIVTVPTGQFLIGTIYLKNDVNLHLESGAVLLGSTKMEDYNPSNLIRGVEVNNISITGKGTIDGQGHTFWIPADRSKIPYDRAPEWIHQTTSPRNMLKLEGCKGVTIQNVHLKGSESWTLHLLGCDQVVVDGISIRNPLQGPNTDGIDMQACSNVRISNSDIYTRDDAICFKNRDPRYTSKVCENITVTNCILTSACNSFKIGTESLGDFKNIVFSNSVIKTARPDEELAKDAAEYIDIKARRYGLAASSGIALESVDGANIQGVTISNIVIDGAWCPIFIRLGNRGAGEQKVSPSVAGTLKDVIISNIVAYNASIASSITSIPGSYVENVILSNIIIKTLGGENKETASIVLDELEKSYPDPKMWGRVLSKSDYTHPIPISGLFVRHAKNIQLDNVQIYVDKEDMRPLVKLEDVEGFYVNNFKTDKNSKGESVLDFKDVREANLLNLNIPATIPWFSFKGNKTNDITIQTFKKIKNEDLIRKEKDVSKEAVRLINL